MRPLRLLAVLEANSVTGPAKNLLQFAGCARGGRFGPPVEVALALFERGGKATPMLEAARAYSLPVYPIHEAHRFDRSVIPALLAAVEEYGADVIQTHSVKSHFLARLAGLGRRAPWVAFHHGYTWPDLRMRLYNRLDRWSLRAADRVITVSIPFREELVSAGVEAARIEIVHNAIDPAWGARASSPREREELRSRLNIAPEEKVALAVGRLSREKDHETLLRAVRRVGERSGGAVRPRVLLVGDGPERGRLVELAAELGISSAVLFVGHVPDPAPYYAAADAVALTSRSEGSPNALLEAMAAGKPVIATAVGGVPEIVSHGDTALLAGAGNVDEIAADLLEVLTRPALALTLGARARRRVVTDYAPEVRTRRLAEIYAALGRRGQTIKPRGAQL
jgi:glycosyltransferase involved in cell wall biosynthesis